MSRDSSLTVWLLSMWVQRAASLPGTVAAGSLVRVLTAAMILSLVAKVLVGAVIFMSGPAALPSSMLVTDTPAGIGAGGGSVASGIATVVGAGGVTAASFFLQPAR